MATTQTPAGLQLHRAHCIQQANLCDREAFEADQRGEWPAATLLASCAAGYRQEAIKASVALLARVFPNGGVL